MIDRRSFYNKIIIGRPTTSEDYEDNEPPAFYCDTCELTWTGTSVTDDSLICSNCGEYGEMIN